MKARIGMAKGAFCKLKELLKGNVNMTTRKRLLNCYVFSVLKYGCESWTVNKNLMKRINAFEQWCYRRMLKISWKDKVPNTEVKELEKKTAILQENCATEIGVFWTCVKRKWKKCIGNTRRKN